ncbi:hypothetical protein K1X84_01510 [bacterium]|nr:hypothetical protein [bacterium]
MKILFSIGWFLYISFNVYGGDEKSDSPTTFFVAGESFSTQLWYNVYNLQTSSSVVSTQPKSVKAALGLSLLFPGAGEIYAENGRESLIKGAAFAAIEITGWLLYFHYKDKGNSLEKKYKRYADENWDINDYLDFLERTLSNYDAGELGRWNGNYVNGQFDGIDFDKLVAAENEWHELTNGAHSIPHSKTQQYYEMIYKYPVQFGQGWSDADPNAITAEGLSGYDYTNLTSNMLYYRGLRNRSNSNLQNATTMTSLFLANRFLSMIDAVWTVKRKNKESKVEIGFRVRNGWINEQFVMMPTVQFTF